MMPLHTMRALQDSGVTTHVRYGGLLPSNIFRNPITGIAENVCSCLFARAVPDIRLFFAHPNVRPTIVELLSIYLRKYLGRARKDLK